MEASDTVGSGLLRRIEAGDTAAPEGRSCCGCRRSACRRRPRRLPTRPRTESLARPRAAPSPSPRAAPRCTQPRDADSVACASRARRRQPPDDGPPLLQHARQFAVAPRRSSLGPHSPGRGAAPLACCVAASMSSDRRRDCPVPRRSRFLLAPRARSALNQAQWSMSAAAAPGAESCSDGAAWLSPEARWNHSDAG